MGAPGASSSVNRGHSRVRLPGVPGASGAGHRSFQGSGYGVSAGGLRGTLFPLRPSGVWLQQEGTPWRAGEQPPGCWPPPALPTAADQAPPQGGARARGAGDYTEGPLWPTQQQEEFS